MLLSESEDAVDLTDSPELRRVTSDWTEGLLGGRVGDVCVSSESRLGSGGASPRAIGEDTAFSLSVLVLCGKAGGAFFAGRAGTAGIVALAGSPLGWGVAVPCDGAGGRETGRLGGGGGGGRLEEGAVKFLCLLRAAILSDRELNVGSSVSAIVLSTQIEEVVRSERCVVATRRCRGTVFQCDVRDLLFTDHSPL